MRRAYYNQQWLDFGINLGADYCAEHEFGIKTLARRCNLNDSQLGIEKRRINNINQNNILLKKEKNILNLVIDNETGINSYKTSLNISECSFSDEMLITAWDECSLLIRTKDNFQKLNNLHQAIVNNNAAIWVASKINPFGTNGLILTIIDQIPKNLLKEIYDQDIDYQKLLAASAQIGIIQKINAFNNGQLSSPCCYFSLNPYWTPENKQTNYSVIYWLNPVWQDKNITDYVTVEELEQWLENKGRIKKE